MCYFTPPSLPPLPCPEAPDPNFHFLCASQKIAGNDHPVYLKSTLEQDFYLYFSEQGAPPAMSFPFDAVFI